MTFLHRHHHHHRHINNGSLTIRCLCIALSCRLQWAGTGVAMGNAESELVKEAADRVTETNDDDGVAIVLEELLASAGSVREFGIQT